MLNLFKVEFLRLVKSKLFIVSVIVCLSLALLNGSVYFIFGIIDGNRSEQSAIELTLMSQPLTGIPGGVLYGIFLISFITTDLRDGTIRNKMVAGYTRLEIYISYLLVALLYVFSLLITSFLLVFICCIFVYNPNLVHFNVSYCLDTLLFIIIGYIMIITLCVLLSLTINGRVVPILIFIGIIYGLVIVGGITDGLSRTFKSDAVSNMFEYLSKINPIYAITEVGTAEGKDIYYEKINFVGLFVIPVLVTIANVFGAIFLFNRKDYK